MPGLDDALRLLGLSTPFIFAVSAYGLFYWIDIKASDEVKAAIESVLKVTDHDKRQVTAALVAIFDRLYTRPLLHWRAFSRSLLATLVITALYFLEEKTVFHSIVQSITGNDPALHGDEARRELTITLFSNVITDYLSLFIIRKLLIASGNRPVLALFTGSIIGMLFIYVAYSVRFFIFLSPSPFPEPLDRIIAIDHLITPLLFPALVVLAWLPLFGLSLLLLRTMPLIYLAVQKMQWFLKDGKNRPLEAVGYVAGAIVFVVAVVWQHLLKGAVG
jgi:hypothetical protein